jgi:hypothetical protein
MAGRWWLSAKLLSLTPSRIASERPGKFWLRYAGQLKSSTNDIEIRHLAIPIIQLWESSPFFERQMLWSDLVFTYVQFTEVY